MAARRLVMARQPLLLQPKFRDQGLCTITSTRLLVGGSRWSSYRRFGAFNDIAQEEANRMKQTTEKLYKHVDDTVVWTETNEATVKKVSSSVKEKISAASIEEVKGTLSMGKQELVDEFTGISTIGEEISKSSETLNHESAETLFGKLKAIMKKGYYIVKDELNDIAKNEFNDVAKDDITKDDIAKDELYGHVAKDDATAKDALNDIVANDDTAQDDDELNGNPKLPEEEEGIQERPEETNGDNNDNVVHEIQHTVSSDDAIVQESTEAAAAATAAAAKRARRRRSLKYGLIVCGVLGIICLCIYIWELCVAMCAVLGMFLIICALFMAISGLTSMRSESTESGTSIEFK